MIHTEVESLHRKLSLLLDRPRRQRRCVTQNLSIRHPVQHRGGRGAFDNSDELRESIGNLHRSRDGFSRVGCIKVLEALVVLLGNHARAIAMGDQ
ncbi:MAG: hypothetical protein BRD51_01095 [Bacteroidetes bacterium SW_11_64_17]|nr:MAG: hypothetical protein BRD51_01095 [Bacteroidetes bacterium SW_11_64_17]